MKLLRKISLLVSLALIGVVTKAADYEVTAADISVTEGEAATLAIELKNAGEAVGFQCDITLPEGVKISGAMTMLRHQEGVHTLVTKVQEGGAMRVLVYSNPNTPFTGNSGIVLNVPLEVTAAVGSYTIKLQNAVVTAPGAVAYYTDDSETTITVKPLYIPVTSVTLDKSTLEIIVGSNGELKATVSPDNATDKSVTWTSSDSKVATVDANGNVTAVSVGTATITAKSGEVTATCEVKVLPIAVSSVTLDKSTLEIIVGSNGQLKATVSPDNATDKSVTWTSSNSKVATVDANGNVTAVSVGNTTITVTCGDKTASCKVTVLPIPVSSITLNKTSITIQLGYAEELIATVSPNNAANKEVTWSSSDNNVVVIGRGDGKVYAVSKSVGTATITATCGGKTATCKVTVVPVEVTSVTLNKTSMELKIGESGQLSATVSPDNATDKKVTWSSSDKSIATVDANGKVTSVSAGTATITATSGKKTATCKVTVSKKIQTITWNQTFKNIIEGNVIELNATASSGLDVVYKVLEGDATIQGNKLTINAAGTIRVEASQPGNKEFYGAKVVEKTINAAADGINDVQVDTEKARYFDLMGRPVENPSRGIYIKVEKNKSTKVIL